MPRKKKNKSAASEKKTNAPVRGRSPEKRQALEAIGLDKPSAEILAEAKAQGITVSRTYVDLLKKKVHGAAGGAKRKPGRPKKSASTVVIAPAKRGPGRPKKSVTTHVSSGASSIEKAFRQTAGTVVIAGGASRARELLEDVVRRVRAAIGALAINQRG